LLIWLILQNSTDFSVLYCCFLTLSDITYPPFFEAAFLSKIYKISEFQEQGRGNWAITYMTFMWTWQCLQLGRSGWLSSWPSLPWTTIRMSDKRLKSIKNRKRMIKGTYLASFIVKAIPDDLVFSYSDMWVSFLVLRRI
jgi:hypothetical protein